jgi:multicomponent Na+:H+ antiporter subunit E
MRLVSLGVVLFCFWLLLSGHYTGLLIAAGVASSAAVAALAWRMRIADAEGHPIHLIGRAVFYWPWLAVEIVKSALRVARLIVDPRLTISPTLVRVRASQKSALGVSIYANSITLTPGTISVDVSGHDIIVHAIERAGADSLQEGEMDRRVTVFEGAK